MNHDRIVQLVALVVMLTAGGVCGRLLPSIIDLSDEHSLRYTDVSVEGAPPFVVLGTAMGAVRGIIVDYLWIKVNIMQQKGLFYEVMADAALITKIQPRFPAVWAFHGHNMAYNISVATHTKEERWEWVNAGIRLVRNEGLRHNPNDLVLHKELAFWFAHKIEGVSDDAHLYYKTEFCREWHFLLGEPPDDYQERIAWIKRVADAPETLPEAQERTPGVEALVERLRGALAPHEQRFRFALDKRFLRAYAEWQAVNESSYVRMMGLQGRVARNEFFRAFDDVAGDPDLQPAWATLISHVRKRVLVDEYNMDPQLMYEYTRDLGPIDWRHGQAHALYWARRGTQYGEIRVPKDEVYKVLNNDRLQLQGMQGLARFGRISFDPFSDEMPTRLPDSRWIDVIDREFDRVYKKYYDTRGGGGESFIGFLQNFLSSATREWYRAGEIEKAQRLLNRLDSLFGSDTRWHNPTYRLPLDVFVRNETFDEYQYQPHIAPSDVFASLTQAFKVGVLQGRPEVTRNAINFANAVTEYFKDNEYSFVNKFGVNRIGGIIGELEQIAAAVLGYVMIDRSIHLADRMAIWAGADEVDSDLRGRVYDRIRGPIEAELAARPIGQIYTVDQVIPPPPNLDLVRNLMELERQARQARAAEAERDPFRRR